MNWENIMNWELINKVRRLHRTSWIKSIYFNFKMLPFKQAIHLPILMTKYTYFYSLPGKIVLNSKPRFAMIRMGFLGEDIITPKDARTLLQIEGTWVVSERVILGCGVTLRIEKDATLITEEDVRISPRVKIICYDRIHICKNTRITWECQIIDTSFHYMRNMSNKEILPLTTPIKIGEGCWICNRSTLMKGTEIPPHTIVASLSLCNKIYNIPEYSLIAGTPAKLIKTDIQRLSFYEEDLIRNKITK